MTLEATWNGNTISRSGNFYNDCWGYVDALGNEYAIIGSPQKIHFIDISNPKAPILKNEFSGGSASLWRDMKTYACYAYAVADEGQEGLIIFDLKALPSGDIVKTYQKTTDFRRAHNIYIDNAQGRLYVIGSDTRNRGLIVYDLTQDPANPTLLASINLPGGYIHDAFVQDNIAYCSHGFSGLYIYDFTDPTAPIYKASINTGGYNHSNWITEDGKQLIYAEEVPIGLPMRIIDLTNVEEDDLSQISVFSASLIDNAPGEVTYHNPHIIDNYAVVSSYEDGVTIFDISDATNPQRIAHYDTYSNTDYSGYNGCWGVYPYFPSGTIIASDGLNGLFILKSTIPLTNDCSNGQLDAFEESVDRGGFCRSNCAYSPSGCSDYDRDGFMADVDCDDWNPLVPATPGSACNDGNPATSNDIIQADACTCLGSE